MNKMANNKNKSTLRINSNGDEYPLIIEDLIPIHSSSSKKNDAREELSTEDFDRAVAMIWMALTESSENSSVETTNWTNIWEPKRVSEA